MDGRIIITSQPIVTCVTSMPPESPEAEIARAEANERYAKSLGFADYAAHSEWLNTNYAIRGLMTAISEAAWWTILAAKAPECVEYAKLLAEWAGNY